MAVLMDGHTSVLPQFDNYCRIESTGKSVMPGTDGCDEKRAKSGMQ